MTAHASVFYPMHNFSHLLKTGDSFRRFFREISEVFTLSRTDSVQKDDCSEIIDTFELIVNLAQHAAEKRIPIFQDTIHSTQRMMNLMSEILDNPSQYDMSEDGRKQLEILYENLSMHLCTILIQQDESLYDELTHSEEKDA